MAGSSLALPAPHPIADRQTGLLTPPWVIYFQHLTRDVGHAAQPPIDAGGGDITGLPGAIAAAGYWTPITNGDPVTPEILFDSNGDCIVGFQPG